MKGGGDMDPRMNNFFVEMDASFMHTMIIPRKFAKMFEGSMSKNIELKGPTGIAWHVKMIRFNDTFALRSGWKEFVRANQIDNGDVLVFTYKGNSFFKVIIFDRSGCQKTAPSFAKKTETKRHLEESNDSSTHEVKKEMVSLSSSSNDTNDSSSEISSRADRAGMAGKWVCGKRKRRDFVEESSKSERDEGEYITVRKAKSKETRNKEASGLYIIPRHTYLTKAQEKIANGMAQRTEKCSDLFVKILNPSNSQRHGRCVLNLPSGFACEVFRSKKTKITLFPANLKKNKTCIANYSKNKIARCIGKGWRQFVCKNGLKLGDLCLFELRKQDKPGNLTMVVHFNRASS